MTNQTSDNSIINAVKRLERLGSEHSKVTEKLVKSCNRVAEFLMDNVPQWVSFGPEYRFIKPEVPAYKIWEGDFDEERDTYKAPKYSVRWHDPENSNLYDGTVLKMGEVTIFSGRDWSRNQALEFAADVANGLLNNASDAIEKEIKRLNAAAGEIESKASILR